MKCLSSRKSVSFLFIAFYIICLIAFPLASLADLWFDPQKVGNAADWYLALGAPLLFVWGYIDHQLREQEKKSIRAEQNAKAIGIDLFNVKTKHLDKERWVVKQIKNDRELRDTNVKSIVNNWPTSFTGNAVVEKYLTFELFNLGSSPAYTIKIELIFHDHRIYFPGAQINKYGYYYPQEGSIDPKSDVDPFWQKAQTSHIKLATSILRNDKTQCLTLSGVQEQELFPHTEIILSWRDDENFIWRRSWELGLEGHLVAGNLEKVGF